MSRRTLLGAVALAGLGGTAGCTPAPVPEPPAEPPATMPPPPVRWAFRAPADVHSVAVGDGLAFVADFDGNVHALDLASGARRWQRADGVSYPLAVAGSTVITTTSEQTRGLDPATGTPRWAVPGRVVASRSDVVLTMGVVPEVGPRLFAVEPGTGAVRWQHVPDEIGVYGSTPPDIAFSADAVHFGSHGYVTLDLATGAQRWRIPIDHDYPGSTAMTVSGAALHAVHTSAPTESVLLAMDLRTGADRWHAVLPTSYVGHLVADGDRLLVCGQFDIAAWDPASGSRGWIWQDAQDRGIGHGEALPASSPIRVGDAVFFAGVGIEDVMLVALDAATGAPRWRLPLRLPGDRSRRQGDMPISPPHPAGPVRAGELLLVSAFDTVYAVAPG